MQGIIGVRRDGKRHSREEIQWLVDAAAHHSVPDYQLSAWLMAAFLNPLDDEETAWLTLAMADSGDRIDLTGLPKPWLDKHSTGGVGDKTTLILLPILAACGLTMVKMSGRGLGITGGTIDKLESIPGFRTDLTPEEMKAQAAQIGLAITGSSPNLAPADKTLYALRDATGTTSSIPLLVSSILSKKIAGGAETVVLDVKSGSGAFMKTREGADALARALIRTAEIAGLRTRVAVTDMDSPLGSAVGNALEVVEAMAALAMTRNANTRELQDLCIELAALAMEACGHVRDREEGRIRARDAVFSGRATAKFQEWIRAQGGRLDETVVRGWAAPAIRPYHHRSDGGYIRRIDAGIIGKAVVDLGGGRSHKEDPLDHRVGIVLDCRIGQRVSSMETLATIHALTDAEASVAAERLTHAIEIGPEPPEAAPKILEIL